MQDMPLYLSAHTKATVCVDTDCIVMQVKFILKKNKKKQQAPLPGSLAISCTGNTICSRSLSVAKLGLR